MEEQITYHTRDTMMDFTFNFNYSSVIITICYHLNYRVRLKIISYFAADVTIFLKLWLLGCHGDTSPVLSQYMLKMH